MLTEDPTIDRGALAALLNAYGIRAARFDFLRVGADGHNYQADGDGRLRTAWSERTVPRGGSVTRRGSTSCRRLCRAPTAGT